MKSLHQCLGDFGKDLTARRREYSIRCLIYRVRGFVNWLATSEQIVRADQLTAEVIVRWHLHADQRRHRVSGSTLRPTTVYGLKKAAQQFCGWLAQHGHASLSLMRNYPVTREPPMPYKTALRHAQVRRVLRAIPTDIPFEHEMRALMEFLYSTGARPSEALQLKLGEVDFDNGLVCLHGKGEKERVVPVGVHALRWLESYQCGIRPLLLRDPTVTALWLNRRGGALRYATFRVEWVELRQRLPALAGVTAYSLRRACATELSRGGADLWAVKEQLGHEELDTLIHYVRPDLEDIKKMHAKFHPRDRRMDDDVRL